MVLIRESSDELAVFGDEWGEKSDERCKRIHSA